MGQMKGSVLITMLVGGWLNGALASSEHKGPPGGPPPTELGPPTLIGDSRPYPIKFTKYNTLVSGSKGSAKFSTKGGVAAAKEPVTKTLQDEECIVISSADMLQALQGCMNQATK